LVAEVVTAVPGDVGDLDIDLNPDDFDANYLFVSVRDELLDEPLKK
jgi:hypothetical protein